MRLNFRRTIRGASAFGAAVAAALFLSSQAPTRAQVFSAREERRNEMENRQRALRSLHRLMGKPDKKSPDRRPSYQEVAEDFQQLQIRNYNLAGVIVPGAQFDHRLIEVESSEVRRRAGRLKSALALPYAKEDAPKKAAEALTAETLKAAIASLDKLVNSFAWNPVFHNPDVLDADNSTKAGRELEEIIRLSEQIKEAARTLGKK